MLGRQLLTYVNTHATKICELYMQSMHVYACITKCTSSSGKYIVQGCCVVLKKSQKIRNRRLAALSMVRVTFQTLYTLARTFATILEGGDRWSSFTS